jgi:hypothetical protein
MSQENLPDADQMSRTRRFIAWARRPWPTPKLIAWIVVGFWLVPGALALTLTGYSWGQFARYTVALLIVVVLGAIWNEREWQKKGSKSANEAAGLRE